MSLHTVKVVSKATQHFHGVMCGTLYDYVQLHFFSLKHIGSEMCKDWRIKLQNNTGLPSPSMFLYSPLHCNICLAKQTLKTFCSVSVGQASVSHIQEVGWWNIFKEKIPETLVRKYSLLLFPNTVFICKSVLRMSQLSLWHTKTKTVRNHYLTTTKKKFKIWWQPAFLRGCSWPSCCHRPPPRPSS